MSFNRKYIILEHITNSSNIISKSEYQSNGTTTYVCIMHRFKGGAPWPPATSAPDLQYINPCMYSLFHTSAHHSIFTQIHISTLMIYGIRAKI